MALGQDGGVIGVADDAGIQPGHGRAIGLGKGLLAPTGQQHVIGRDTGLPRIEQLAMGNLERGIGHVAILGDQAGGLAAQLQRGRRQVHRGGLGHAPAHGRGAGEHQVIEGQARELGRHIDIALHHAELVGREKLRHQRRQLGRGVGREFAGLEHHAVARGQRRDGRRQGQLQGIVPGRNHAHHTQRLALYARPRGQQVQRRAHFLRLHPARELAQTLIEQIAQHKEIRHFGQTRRTHAEIGLHRRRQHRPMLLQHLAHTQQSLAAHQQRHIHLSAAGLVLDFKQAMEIGRNHAHSQNGKHPLSGCAASPSQPSVEGDGTLGAGRPFLGAPTLGSASFRDCW
ncbi:hypothetical protein D3C78_877190 [compost metagenome]